MSESKPAFINIIGVHPKAGTTTIANTSPVFQELALTALDSPKPANTSPYCVLVCALNVDEYKNAHNILVEWDKKYSKNGFKAKGIVYLNNGGTKKPPKNILTEIKQTASLCEDNYLIIPYLPKIAFSNKKNSFWKPIRGEPLNPNKLDELSHLTYQLFYSIWKIHQENKEKEQTK